MKKLLFPALLPLVLLATPCAHAATPAENQRQAVTQMLQALNLIPSLHGAVLQSLAQEVNPDQKDLAGCVSQRFDEAAVTALVLPAFQDTLSTAEAQRLTTFFHSGTGLKIAQSLSNPQVATSLTPAETKAIQSDAALATALSHLGKALSDSSEKIVEGTREKAVDIANNQCQEFLPKTTINVPLNHADAAENSAPTATPTP